MRLIDADAFLERMSHTDRFFGVVYDINDAPTVDAVPVVPGQWIEDHDYLKCPECGVMVKRDFTFFDVGEWNFCPNCGVRMDADTYGWEETMKMNEITKMTPDTGKRETIKTPFAKIIVGGTAEKPYYMICYYDSADKQFVLCCGSYNIDYVFQWYREDFEIIDNGGFDAVSVVRCRECKHCRNLPNGLCYLYTEPYDNERGYKGEAVCVEPDDFCSCGERRTDNA